MWYFNKLFFNKVKGSCGFVKSLKCKINCDEGI